MIPAWFMHDWHVFIAGMALGVAVMALVATRLVTKWEEQRKAKGDLS